MSPNRSTRLTRLTLPTSVQEFGFAHSSSAPPSPSLNMTFEFDEPFPDTTPDTSINTEPCTTPILRRFGRNTLAVRTGSLNDLNTRIQSPLRSSFSRRTISTERPEQQDESDSEREKSKEKSKSGLTMDRSEGSPSSGSDLPTPPLPLDTSAPNQCLQTTTPRSTSSTSLSNMSVVEAEPKHLRRLSHSVKPPRLLSLMAESNPTENEVKSEAQFQRMLASYNGLPIARPRAGRAMSDRGRYPEEAGGEDDESKRDDTPTSEDDELASMTAVGSYGGSIAPPPGSAPIGINLAEDAPMLESFRNSPSGSFTGMDIDMPPPPFTSSSSSSANTASASPVAWRQTPPPTGPPVRPNKRKYEDRYDPYPSSSKRRAVSPSLSVLRDSLSHAISTPIAVPMPRSPAVRSSMSMSVASSPGAGPAVPLSHSMASNFSMGFVNGMPMSRPISTVSSPISSSPQHRPVALLSSPVLRPMHRITGSNGNMEKAFERGQKEVDGAGEAVGSLSLG